MIYRLLWLLVEWVGSQVRKANASPGRQPLSDDLMLLAAAVDRGTDCWAAREPGECVTCGHEWIEGEIIGAVHQMYLREGDGRVRFCPDVRRACCVCVERQRVQGDPSLRWARDAGVLTR